MVYFHAVGMHIDALVAVPGFRACRAAEHSGPNRPLEDGQLSDEPGSSAHKVVVVHGALFSGRTYKA